MTVDINDTIRVVVHYDMPNAGDMQNVFKFKLTGASVDEQDLLDDLDVWMTDEWGDKWADLAATAATLFSYDVDTLNPDGTVKANIGGNIVNLAGTLGTHCLSPMDSGYILGYTDDPRTRGSKYIPGMGEDAANAGEWEVGVLANLGIILSVYLATVAVTGGGTLLPGILSTVSATFIPFITSGLIDTVAATQRRRKEGVGI